MRKNLGRLGGVRLVCVQQVPLDVLCLRVVPDRLPESALSGRVHGGAPEPEPVGHQEDQFLHGRVQTDGGAGQGAGREQEPVAFLGGQRTEYPLRYGGDQRFGRECRAGDLGRTARQRRLSGYFRFRGAGQFADGQ